MYYMYYAWCVVLHLLLNSIQLQPYRFPPSTQQFISCWQIVYQYPFCTNIFHHHLLCCCCYCCCCCCCLSLLLFVCLCVCLLLFHVYLCCRWGTIPTESVFSGSVRVQTPWFRCVLVNEVAKELRVSCRSCWLQALLVVRHDDTQLACNWPDQTWLYPARL